MVTAGRLISPLSFILVFLEVRPKFYWSNFLTIVCYLLKYLFVLGADFSIPDVNGEQPRNQKIIPDGPLTCETNVPVFDVVKSLNEPNLFEVSADPGRFVCNYTYYLSSQLAKTSSNPNMTVLFVHIPPFSKLSQEICQSACLRLCLTVANAMRHKYPTELSMYNFMNKALKGSILSKIFLQSSERAVSFASPSASPSRSVISSPNRARPLIHAETNTDNHNSEECMKIVKIPLSHLPSDHPGCLMRCCHGKCTSKVVADLNNSLDNNTSVVYDKAPSPFVNSILYDTPPVEDIYASACLDAIQTELSESWLDAGEHNDQVTSCLDDVKMNNDDFAPAAVPINTEKCLCGCEGDVSEVRNERKMIPAMKSLTTDTHHVSVGTEHIEKRTKSVSTSSNPMVDQQTSTNLCVTPPSSVRYRTL